MGDIYVDRRLGCVKLGSSPTMRSPDIDSPRPILERAIFGMRWLRSGGDPEAFHLN